MQAAADTIARVEKRQNGISVVNILESRTQEAGPWAAFQISAAVAHTDSNGDEISAVKVDDAPWPEASLGRRASRSRLENDQAAGGDVMAALRRCVAQAAIDPPIDTNLPPGTRGVKVAILIREMQKSAPDLREDAARKRITRELAATSNQKVLSQVRGTIWFLPDTAPGLDNWTNVQ